MFNLRLCNAATIRYSLLKFGHMHLCGKDYKHFSPHCCKCNSFGCIAAIRCVNACHGPHNDSVYSGSEHRQFNSPRLVKREAGFPNPRRALIGSNQLWRVNDSPYYRELPTNQPTNRAPVTHAKFVSLTSPCCSRWPCTMNTLKTTGATPAKSHPAFAGSGVGCVMYTLEGTKRSSGPTGNFARNGRRTA